jgi:tetratricopeptide (TPR) repeat protein
MAQPYNYLRNTLADDGQLDEAATVYRQALALDPNSSKTYDNLGNALGGQGKFDESIIAPSQSDRAEFQFPRIAQQSTPRVAISSRLQPTRDHEGTRPME